MYGMKKTMKKKMMGGGMAYGKKKKMRDGGKMLKDVPEGNKGLGKLPKSVRNKMGFKRDGGMMYGKKKMMGGGSVNENINPYGRPADTSLI
jgi:hypothetical protein